MFLSTGNRFSKNIIKLGYGSEIINQKKKNGHIPATFSEVFKTSYFISFQKREEKWKFALQWKYFIWHKREVQSLWKSENSISGEDIDTTFPEILESDASSLKNFNQLGLELVLYARHWAGCRNIAPIKNGIHTGDRKQVWK